MRIEAHRTQMIMHGAQLERGGIKEHDMVAWFERVNTRHGGMAQRAKQHNQQVFRGRANIFLHPHLDARDQGEVPLKEKALELS